MVLWSLGQSYLSKTKYNEQGVKMSLMKKYIHNWDELSEEQQNM